MSMGVWFYDFIKPHNTWEDNQDMWDAIVPIAEFTKSDLLL